VNVDLALVGGGLANSLIAYRLRSVRPELRVVLIEQADRLGGNHTWSFHAGDLSDAQHAWMAPFVEYAWGGYEVRFPELTRRIGSGYYSFTASRLHDVLSEALGDDVLLDAPANAVAPGEVRLADGRCIRARGVVDGRGDPRSPHLVLRYQKFVGRVLELESTHGLSEPLLMDATVAQDDGYRFVYTLPLEHNLALVEDTRYSDSPTLARGELGSEIDAYAQARGWRVRQVHREEEGVLPIVLAGDIDAFWRDGSAGVARSGLRAALFHPTTGYSLPEAVRLADTLAAAGSLEQSDLLDMVRRRSLWLWRRGKFFRLLNRMLFLAGKPQQRFRVLERFYRLPESLIGRFYAGRLTWRDRVRLLCGAPPVPIGGALRAMLASGHSSVASRSSSAPSP
jgi:lycopene beta-cyclase